MSGISVSGRNIIGRHCFVQHVYQRQLSFAVSSVHSFLFLRNFTKLNLTTLKYETKSACWIFFSSFQIKFQSWLISLLIGLKWIFSVCIENFVMNSTYRLSHISLKIEKEKEKEWEKYADIYHESKDLRLTSTRFASNAAYLFLFFWINDDEKSEIRSFRTFHCIRYGGSKYAYRILPTNS